MSDDTALADDVKLLMREEEEFKKLKKTQLKEFVKNYPQYIKGKKVHFPILDEYLLTFKALFPNQSTFPAKPEGRHECDSIQQLNVACFLNNFPISYSFARITDTYNS